MRVGFLGPLGTISQEVVQDAFENPELAPQNTLLDVVDALANDLCDFAAIPYHNTHEKHIRGVRQAIAKNQNLVFVNRMIRHRVTHCLYSFGGIAILAELWSKNVVFNQVSDWVGTHAPSATCKNFESTALAVEEAQKARDARVGAIGSQIAQQFYPDIPVIAEGIQNRDNFTTFAILARERRFVRISERILVMGINASEEDFAVLIRLLREFHLRIASMDPALPLTVNDPSIMIFEIDYDPTFNVSSPAVEERQAFLTEMSTRLRNFSFMGGFAGPSLSTLFNSHES